MMSLDRRRIFVTTIAACALLLVVVSYRSTARHHDGLQAYSMRPYTLTNATKDACTGVINRQRDRLFDTFSDVFDGVHNIALISMPDHENKGDSAIYVAEQLVLATLGINVQYVCGVKDYDAADLRRVVDEFGDDRFAIVFHGGGNFGDLYGREHELKMSVMNSFPHVRTHIFPQSIKFNHDEQIKHTHDILASLTHPRNSIAVRDEQSFAFAKRHFDLPNLRIDMTPDIVFFMGFRPDLRARLQPSSPDDILWFARKDVEGSGWDWAGGRTSQDFPRPFVKQLSSELGLKRTITAKTGDWIDWDLTDKDKVGGHIEFRAWTRFMTGVAWLSTADFIVLDRLHGHIISLLLGIPHVLVDNNIGKLSDYYTTWTHECPLATLVVPDENRPKHTAARVIEAYGRWVAQGKISGKDFR